MFNAHIISTDDGTYKLSALVTKNGFEMPSLYMIEEDSNTDTTLIDNPEYLFGEFHDRLKQFIAADDYTGFMDSKNLSFFIDEENFKQLGEMLDHAVAIGFPKK